MLYRVRYREELEVQKQEALNVRREEEAQLEQEKEARLEALREKVRVVAEPDPYRLIKDTEVCKSPLSNLFSIPCFSIIKLYMALREKMIDS